MSDVATPTYYYPNKMGRIVLQALEEVVGRNGLIAVLNLANLLHFIGHYPENNLERGFSFDDLSRMMTALEQLYGPRGGRGLALRTGRVCFKYGIREFGPMVSVAELSYRLLPLDLKLRQGAEIFRDIFNQYSDQQVVVEETPQAFYWRIERCPVCWKRRASQPVCQLAVGVLQEALYWVSNGKYFTVEETTCIAKGDPSCTLVIYKQPLD